MNIRDIAFALPVREVDSAEISKWTGAEESFIVNKIGISTRRFLGPDEPPLSLSKRACDELFLRNNELQLADVQLLIVVTQNPDYKLPHSSALLQHAIGLPLSTACFDINLGCSGYVYALAVAKGLMSQFNWKNAILVTCDPYSKIMGAEDRDTVTVFGDAATATWLSSEKGGAIGVTDFGTDGGGARHLMVKAGGAANPISQVFSRVDVDNHPPDMRLTMNGRAILNFMLQRVPQTVRLCLEKNDLAFDQVNYFIFHQASKFMIENLRQKLGLSEEKAPCDITQIGNTVSSSIPIALSKKMDGGDINNSYILLSGFGVGLSWATTIIKFGGVT